MQGCCKRPRLSGSVAWLIVPLLFARGDIASAVPILYIGNTASYANLNKVREKVREECAPDTQLPIMMREEIQKRTSLQQIMPTDEPSAMKNGLAITFSILSLNIPPSAGWTTEKRSMKVKSIVYRDGAVVNEYVRYADDQGGGRLFNRSACHIVETLTRDIAEHTAEWFRTKVIQDASQTIPGTKR